MSVMLIPIVPFSMRMTLDGDQLKKVTTSG
jgi:hypothetical protein